MPLKWDVCITPESRHTVSYAADCDLIACYGWSGADRQASSGGEVDTIFGFEKEADALERIKTRSRRDGC